MAVDAVGGRGQGFEALGRNRLAACLARPERPGCDALQGALDLYEVQLVAPAELLAALALGDFGGGSGLRAVGDLGELDLFGKFQA